MDLASVFITAAMAAIMTLGGVAIGARITIRRLREQINPIIDSYLVTLPERLSKNPKFAEDLAQPFIAAALKQLGVGQPGGVPKSLNFMGIKIPGPIVEMLANRFLGPKVIDATATAAEEAKSVVLG